MQPLYQITNDIRSIHESLESGEIELDVAMQLLDQMDEVLDEKIHNVSLHVKNLKSEIEMIKAEEASLKSRRQSTEKQLDFYREYLMLHMKANGKDKLTFGNAVIAVKQNPWSVECDVDSLPDDYIVEKVTVTANKKLIKEQIQAGNDIAGAKLVRTERIDIK